MLDLDEVLNRESAKLDTAQDLESKLAKREVNYMMLKQKIIATASVIKSFKACKIECQEKDTEIKSLKAESSSLRNDYKKALLDNMTLDKNYEELARKFEYIKEQNTSLDIREKSTQAHNTQLQNLLMITEEKLVNSEKDVESKKIENGNLKDEINKSKQAALTQVKKNTQAYEKKLDSLYKSIFKFGDKAFSSGVLTKEEKALLRKCKKNAKSDGVIVDDMDITLHLELDDILENAGRAGPPSCTSTDTGLGSSIYTSDDEKYPSAATTPTRESCFSPRYGDFDVFTQSEQKNLNDDILSNNEAKPFMKPLVQVVVPPKSSPLKISKIKTPSPIKKKILINSKSIMPKIKESDSINSQIMNILNEMKSSVNLISPMPSSDEDVKKDNATSNSINPIKVQTKRILKRRFKPVKYSLTRKLHQKRLTGITSYLMALTKKIAKEEVNKALQSTSTTNTESNPPKPLVSCEDTKPVNSNPVVIIQGLNNMNQVSIPQGPGVYIINNIPASNQLPASCQEVPVLIDKLPQNNNVIHTTIEKTYNNEENPNIPVNTDTISATNALIMNDNASVTVLEKQPTSPKWDTNESNIDIPVHVVSPVRRNPRRFIKSPSVSSKDVSQTYDSCKSILQKKPVKAVLQSKFGHLFDSHNVNPNYSVLNKSSVTLNVGIKRKRTCENKNLSSKKKPKHHSFSDVPETTQNDNNVDMNTESTTREANHASKDMFSKNVPPPRNRDFISIKKSEVYDKREEAKLLLADYYKKKGAAKPIFINRKKAKPCPTEAPNNVDEIMQNMKKNTQDLQLMTVRKTVDDVHETILNGDKTIAMSTKSASYINDSLIHLQPTLSENVLVENTEHSPGKPHLDSENLESEPQRNLIVHDYEIFETTTDSTSEQDKQLFASIIRNNMTSKTNKKSSSKVEKSNINLNKRLEEYLLNGFSKARLDSLLEKISQEKEKSLAQAMVDFLSQERDKDHIMIHQPPISSLNIYQLTLLTCINRIHANPPSHFKHDIFDLVMRGIEYKSFALNNDRPSVRSLSNMATFYAALCRITKQKDKLKLFCMDAIYCYSYKSTPIIYAVLQSWNQLFPKSHFNVAKDPLFSVMIHSLQSNFSEKIEFQSQNMQRLLSTKYGFKPGEYNDDGIVECLVEAVKGLKTNMPTRNLQAAFLLLGKRFDVKDCHRKIIIGSLLPILEDAKSSVESRAFVAGLIGPLLRPYPASMTMECEVFLKKLSVMLSNRDSPLVEEGLVSSLTYLSKKNFNMAVKPLIKWQPMAPISELTRNLLTSLVSEKPFNFWNNFLNCV